MKLDELYDVAKARGSNAFAYAGRWTTGSSADMWSGYVAALYHQKVLTTSETLDLCIQLEAAGAVSDHFVEFKQRVLHDYMNNRE